MLVFGLIRLRFAAVLAATEFGPWAARLTVAALVAICGVFGLTLYDSRQDSVRETMTSAENLSTAVTQDIARNIEVIDLSLQAVVDGVSDPEVMGMRPAIRRMILFDRAASARYLGITLVLDTSGHVVLDSAGDAPRAGDFADRDYFAVHAARTDAGLYVSRPFLSRVSNAWNIALSRRIAGPDGRFAGVAVATLRLSYFRDLFSRMSLGHGGSMTLFRDDGTIVMREPFDEATIGRSLAGVPAFAAMSAQRAGQFEAVSAIDGRRRMSVFRHVGDLPLIQNVGVAVDDVFAAWWRKTIALCATLLALCSIVVALISLLGVQLRRRAEAEAALAALAMTDKLTGLANRRRFDEVLDSAWRRAARDRQPLSLLMMDADSFKAYNDRYGHLAGDGVLERIGQCTAGRLRRPGDMAARYGGEEFAVLLADTDAAGAYEVAETIRTRVLEECEPHAGSTHGVVTLSIGVASLIPRADQSASEIVAAADAALYASKGRGRNRTTLANSSSAGQASSTPAGATGADRLAA